MKSRNSFLVLAISIIGLNLFTGCLQGNGEPLDDPQDPTQTTPTTPTTPSTPTTPTTPIEYAPASLKANYIFVEYLDTRSIDWIIIASATEVTSADSYDQFNKKRINTPYTYTKTGANTATFSYKEQSYINGPVVNIQTVHTGTLTFTSPTLCTFSGSYNAYRNGTLTGTIKVGPETWDYLPLAEARAKYNI
jgi:hypothetical protein